MVCRQRKADGKGSGAGLERCGADGADCTDTAETETTGMETEETESDSTETVENNDIEINMPDDSKVTEEKEIVRRTVEIKDDSDDLTFIDLK